jgi:hypothetical protein
MAEAAATSLLQTARYLGCSYATTRVRFRTGWLLLSAWHAPWGALVAELESAHSTAAVLRFASAGPVDWPNGEETSEILRQLLFSLLDEASRRGLGEVVQVDDQAFNSPEHGRFNLALHMHYSMFKPLDRFYMALQRWF